MFGEIVVGWSGSGLSSRAAEWAARHAARSGRTLVLLRAVDNNDDGVVPPEEFDACCELTEEEAARLARVEPNLRVRAIVERGSLEVALRHFSLRADLVVLGRRAHPERGFHTVVGTLATRSACPVVAVPFATDAAPRGIVVGIDGTQASVLAAMVAAQEATAIGEPLTIAHSWLEPSAWQTAFPLGDEMIASIEDVHRRTLHAIVTEVQAAFPELTVTPKLLRGSAQSVLVHADDHPELIVVGSRARSVAAEVLLGSVAYEAALHADHPVMIVREDGIGPVGRRALEAARHSAAPHSIPSEHVPLA
ncbi:nucleotide-binding universal stress UspA family protein [Galbitalea soli]|nr:nucleotide-binding universal stress UspA family protein [Galbitalea soli]